MLETPIESAVLLSEKSVELDNQQATSRIAGLYMGEGHFTLARYPRKNGKWHIETEVGFSNKDPILIDLVCGFLERYGIHHFIGMNNATCYQVRVTRHGDLKALLEILVPYLCGRKLAEARLLYRFIIHAMEKWNRPVESTPGMGQRSGFDRRRANLAFDDVDMELCEAKQRLKESSETIRIPRCWSEHGYNMTKRYGPATPEKVLTN